MRWYAATDTGLVRKSNQDSYVIATNEAGDVFAVVCDGIGGGRSGDIASQTTIQYFSDVFSRNSGFKDEEEAATWLRFHIRKANDAVFSLSTTKKEYQGMGTTLVGALIAKFGILIVNVGDSRAYGLYPNNRLIQLTEDHTLVEDMVHRGDLTPEEAVHHPKRNLLTNALGIWDNIKVDVTQIEAPVYLLVCSDGLHGYVEESRLNAILAAKQGTLQQKAKKLMNEALLAGGQDNITIILIQLSGGSQHE